jgi:hypothetical protein
MPDAHESCRNAPDQPHACSRFIVYNKEFTKAQEGIQIFAGKFTDLVLNGGVKPAFQRRLVRTIPARHQFRSW